MCLLIGICAIENRVLYMNLTLLIDYIYLST